jgi:hypothetical protein
LIHDCPSTPPCTVLLEPACDELPSTVCASTAVLSTANFGLTHLQLPLSDETASDPRRRELVAWAGIWPLACSQTARHERLMMVASMVGWPVSWLPGLELPVDWLGLVVTRRTRDGYIRLLCPVVPIDFEAQPIPGGPVKLRVIPTAFAQQPFYDPTQWRFEAPIVQVVFRPESGARQPLNQLAQGTLKWYGHTVLHRSLRVGGGTGHRTYPTQESFKHAFAAAVRELQRKHPGRKISASAVRRNVRTSQGHIDRGLFTRWYQALGWPKWDDFLADLAAEDEQSTNSQHV